MRRAQLALAAATIALAAVSVAMPDGLSDSTQKRASATPQLADSAASTPTASTFVRPIWRLDIPKGGGPFAARVSPNARMVAVETGARDGGAVLYELRPPVAPSDVAELREIVKLDGAASPVLWLPDSSGLLAYTPDGPSSPSGTLSLVGASGKRWSIAGSAVSTLSGARFSPNGRQVAVWANPGGVLVVALDGTASQKFVGDNDRSFLGWDAEGNVLFRLTTTNMLEARAADQRVAYTVALPQTLRYLNGGAAAVPQPSDLVLLWFESGCCAPRQHIPLVLFDRALHEIPAELEDVPTTIGDGPWRGTELIVRRKADTALWSFDPRTGAERPLGVTLSDTEAIWGISGDYFALGRRIVELSTGREIPLSATTPQEVIMAVGSGRFVLWRDGTTQLLDAAAWMATPQDLTGALAATPDQVGVQQGWVRVRDDDGGFTIALPTFWHAYDGTARGAVLASEVLVPANAPSAGEMRIEIRLDIAGARGPGDFLEGLAHHGGVITERRTVTLASGSAEFATVYDNTLYPRPATTMNWALRSPFYPERIVWIRAWPLESGRRADAEAIVATLQFVAPR